MSKLRVHANYDPLLITTARGVFVLTELLEAQQFTIGESLGINTKIQCRYANALIIRIIKEILSCHKSEAAFSNKSDSSTAESTSYVTSATRAVWCATAQSVLQALDGTKAASCEMRFSTWSKLLSHYRWLNAHLPNWMTKQCMYTKGSSAVWFRRLKLDLHQHVHALTATTNAQLLHKQQQSSVKTDHKPDSSTPNATRLQTAVVTKSARPFAKYLATAQQQQLDTITALLQCFSCCCETLIGVHSVSVQSGMNILIAEFQGLDVFELLQNALHWFGLCTELSSSYVAGTTKLALKLSVLYMLLSQRMNSTKLQQYNQPYCSGLCT
eukprot:17153-Heterococcus_DN1.PRE.6